MGVIIIIGDHVIVCYHRALDNQVYALQLVLVWLEMRQCSMCPGHLCPMCPMCPCQHLRPCGEGVVHTLVLPCWCSRIFAWHAILVSMVKFALNTYFVCLCLWMIHTTTMLMIIVLSCSCPGVRWWSVLVTRRLSHVLILVSYYHCVECGCKMASKSWSCCSAGILTMHRCERVGLPDSLQTCLPMKSICHSSQVCIVNHNCTLHRSVLFTWYSYMY